jgi:hypothetical protein
MSCVRQRTAFHVRNPWQLGVNRLAPASHNKPIQLRTSKILDAYSYRSLDTAC